MKIAHLADIHIRPYKYLDEMEYTFDRLYESLDEKKPNVIVICGDTFHSKLTVSNEYFQTASKLFKNLTDRAQLIIIPGNHDMALGNQNRLDAITPIIEAIQDSVTNMITYSKYSEQIWTWEPPKNELIVIFHHFSILDEKTSWPNRKHIQELKADPRKIVNIALYHGSINGCKMDNGWLSRGNKDSLDIFDEFDYAFLGDIHVQQFLTPKIAYAGSLRQNNYGENVDKGYLFWNIRSKDDFEVESVSLLQKRYFFTLYGSTVQDIEGIGELPDDCRIRLQLTKDIDLVEQLRIKSKIEELYRPSNDIPILPAQEDKIDIGLIKAGSVDILHENIRQPEVQKKILEEFFKEKNLSNEDLEDLFEIDKKYHSYIETDIERNVIYDITSMKWDNSFSYGRDNIIDFTKLNGLIGIFAPNATGKSALIDTLSLGLFNQIFREGANKNVDYVNRKCKNLNIDISFKMNAKDYLIKRMFKKHSTKRGEDKCDTDINFYEINGKEKICLNGEDKPSTNKNIRQKIGTDEDFNYLSFCPQFDLIKFINARGTERKRILSKYFDLEIFDTKYQVAKKDYDLIKYKLEDLDYSKINENITSYEEEILSLEKDLSNLEQSKLKLYIEIDTLDRKLKNLYSNIVHIQFDGDIKSYRKLIPHLELQIKDKESKLNLAKGQFIQIENKISKEELSQKEKILNKEIAKLQIEYDVRLNKLEQDKKTSELLKTIPDVPQCKVCPLAKHAYDAKEDIITKIDEVKKLSNQIQSLKKEKEEQNISKILSNIDLNQKNELTIKTFQLEIQDLKAKLANCLSKETEYEKFSDSIEKNETLKTEIEKLEKEQNNLKFNLSEITKEIIKKTSSFVLVKEKLNLNKENLEKCNKFIRQKYLYDLYLDAVGKNGISYWIISKKMHVINKQVNIILSHCVNFKLSIEENLEEKSIKIYIIDEHGKRPVELGSGAEKTISSIALRAALWNICLLPKTSLLILDEAFSYLDAEKSDGVIRLLSYLKNYFKKIIIITHDDGLKTMMDDSYYITRKNGFAKCEID